MYSTHLLERINSRQSITEDSWNKYGITWTLMWDPLCARNKSYWCIYESRSKFNARDIGNLFPHCALYVITWFTAHAYSLALTVWNNLSWHACPVLTSKICVVYVNYNVRLEPYFYMCYLLSWLVHISRNPIDHLLCLKW